MQTNQDSLGSFAHRHDYGAHFAGHEVRTRWVVVLTFAMMVFELIAGYATNSLALTADGWHMATHAGALGISALAYWFARTRTRSSTFTFGTGKVHALAGYTSAVVLALIALWMMGESLRRLSHPQPIAFAEALPVAVLGLVVNLVSVRLLEAEEHQGEHDHNLRAAYFHVLADALTSVLAILALLGGSYLGWAFLDPLMGIVGGVVIARWSYGLCTGAARQLLDVVPSADAAKRIRRCIEGAFEATEVVDLHLWEVGPRARACIVSIVAAAPQPSAAYREVVLAEEPLDHLTIEVHASPADRVFPPVPSWLPLDRD